MRSSDQKKDEPRREVGTPVDEEERKPAPPERRNPGRALPASGAPFDELFEESTEDEER